MKSTYSIGCFIRNLLGRYNRRVLLALFIVPVCNSPLSAQSEEAIPFTTVLKTTRSSIGSSIDLPIGNVADWQTFWNEIHAGPSPIPPLPEIDFSKRMIIIAALGVQPAPRHLITITRIERVKTMIKVFIEETQPGRDCSPLGALTNPIHIVETEKLSFITFRRSIGSRCADPD